VPVSAVVAVGGVAALLVDVAARRFVRYRRFRFLKNKPEEMLKINQILAYRFPSYKEIRIKNIYWCIINSHKTTKDDC